MIPADVVFLLLAGVAFLGFVLDALFDRLRITSVLPLMLLGVVLVATGAVPPGTIAGLDSLIPYVSALTIAFILFVVGLEIRFTELFRVLGRATAYTLVVQIVTGIALAFLAYSFAHWSLFISFIFGFCVSGPSSVAVPTLVRVARMTDSLRTTLLYESVISDVLQLLVPLTMLDLLVGGNFSPANVSGLLLWTLLGSAVGGLVAGVAWLWILDRLREFAKGYSWTLTVTMVLATYGISAHIGVSPAITIFVFGLVLGNALLFDSKRIIAPGRLGWLRLKFQDLVRFLRLSPRSLDIPHVLQVQREVSFFASAFFFVYIGLLFQLGGFDLLLLLLAGASAAAILTIRLAFSPLLRPYLDPDPTRARSQRGLVSFNIARGLAPAVIATVPLGLGLVIPGFLDAVFLAILISTLVSTVGIFVFYAPSGRAPAPPPGISLSMPVHSPLDGFSAAPDPMVPTGPTRPVPAAPSPEPDPGEPPPLPTPRGPTG